MAALVGRRVGTSKMLTGSTAEHKAVSDCAAIAEDFLQVRMVRCLCVCLALFSPPHPSVLCCAVLLLGMN